LYCSLAVYHALQAVVKVLCNPTVLKLRMNCLPWNNWCVRVHWAGRHAGVLTMAPSSSTRFGWHWLATNIAHFVVSERLYVLQIPPNFCLQERWGEAARRLANVLNDDTFRSIEGKSKHQLWLELCDLITKHPADVLKEGIDVDAILRGGIRKYKDEVRLEFWSSAGLWVGL
jgi:hypothetical protein